MEHRGALESRGLRATHISALSDRLEAAFRADDVGFALLRSSGHVRTDAIRADETLRAPSSAARHLLVAALAREELSEAVGSGLTFAGAANNDPDLAVERALSAFFQAFASVLDTIAAASIGMLGAPRSVERADYLDLLSLASEVTDNADLQQAQWAELDLLVRAQAEGEPQPWLDYGLAYRNAIIHRPQQLVMNVPLPREPSPLVVVTNNQTSALLAISRFRPHLRRRPWASDLEEMIDRDEIFDAWLHEDASVTLAGLLQRLNDFGESVCEFLLRCWDKVEQGALQLKSYPVRRRPHLDREPLQGFAGFTPPTPGTSPGDIGVVNPLLAERIRLARIVQARQ